MAQGKVIALAKANTFPDPTTLEINVVAHIPSYGPTMAQIKRVSGFTEYLELPTDNATR